MIMVHWNVIRRAIKYKEVIYLLPTDKLYNYELLIMFLVLGATRKG